VALRAHLNPYIANSRPMTATSQSSSTGNGSHPQQSSSGPAQSTEPVEMSELNTKTGAGSSGLLNNVSIPATSPMSSGFPSTSDMAGENSKPVTSTESAAAAPSEATRDPLSKSHTNIPTTPSTSSAAGISSAPHPAVSRNDSVAIGPSSNTMLQPSTTSEPSSSIVNITLLLTSGARHPYKIDEKYLTKRSVNVPGVTESGRKDPYSISVYTLKELILREWREEWEAQPSSPSSIRLIFFGKLLDDKIPLKGNLLLRAFDRPFN